LVGERDASFLILAAAKGCWSFGGGFLMRSMLCSKHARNALMSMQAGVKIERITEPSDAAVAILNEYYESLEIQVRDTAESLGHYIADADSGLWLAWMEGELVGCVILRPLPLMENAAECKRLYLRPAARGRGIAHALLDALETYAEAQGYRAIYLDTHDGLTAAIGLYHGRGYVDCARYNDNPQATIFMQKSLGK